MILSLQRIRVAFWFYIEWTWANFKNLAFSVVQHGKSDYFDLYCANQMRNADLFDNIVWSHGLQSWLNAEYAFSVWYMHLRTMYTFFVIFLLCKVRINGVERGHTRRLIQSIICHHISNLTP